MIKPNLDRHFLKKY